MPYLTANSIEHYQHKFGKIVNGMKKITFKKNNYLKLMNQQFLGQWAAVYWLRPTRSNSTWRLQVYMWQKEQPYTRTLSHLPEVNGYRCIWQHTTIHYVCETAVVSFSKSISFHIWQECVNKSTGILKYDDWTDVNDTWSMPAHEVKFSQFLYDSIQLPGYNNDPDSCL
jgi:hypothetical protein